MEGIKKNCRALWILVWCTSESPNTYYHNFACLQMFCGAKGFAITMQCVVTMQKRFYSHFLFDLLNSRHKKGCFSQMKEELFIVSKKEGVIFGFLAPEIEGVKSIVGSFRILQYYSQ